MVGGVGKVVVVGRVVVGGGTVVSEVPAPSQELHEARAIAATNQSAELRRIGTSVRKPRLGTVQARHPRGLT